MVSVRVVGDGFHVEGHPTDKRRLLKPGDVLSPQTDPLSDVPLLVVPVSLSQPPCLVIALAVVGRLLADELAGLVKESL
jgi:hypothetical protein